MAQSETINVKYAGVDTLYLTSPPGKETLRQPGAVFLHPNGKLAPQTEEFAYTAPATVSGADPTFTASEVYGTLHQFRIPGAPSADTLPTAPLLIAEFDDATVGNAISRKWTAGDANAITITANTGMTIVGSAVIPANSSRDVIFEITSATTMDVRLI